MQGFTNPKTRQKRKITPSWRWSIYEEKISQHKWSYLVIACISKHFSYQPCTFPNVFINYGTWNNLYPHEKWMQKL